MTTQKRHPLTFGLNTVLATGAGLGLLLIVGCAAESEPEERTSAALGAVQPNASDADQGANAARRESAKREFSRIAARSLAQSLRDLEQRGKTLEANAARAKLDVLEKEADRPANGL
jgi:hypothetical protein